MNVLIVEYPGYSVYQSESTSEQGIIDDADKVYDFITHGLFVQPARIFIAGRSIGTGPATYLASKHKVAGLFLISPFTNIKEVVKDYAGSIIEYLVKERFNNIERIVKVKSPVLLIHGKDDELVKVSHSDRLYGR